MSELIFRSAEPDDQSDIYALFHEMQSEHAHAYPDLLKQPQQDALFSQYFNDILTNPDSYISLGQIKGVTIGYILYFIGHEPNSVFQKAQTRAYIQQISINKAHKRKGYGSYFLQHVIGIAKQRGISLISLDVWRFNKDAAACFSKQGFTEISNTMILKL